MKLKIHPLFVALCIYFVFTGRALLLAGYTVAVIAHEAAHSRAAAWRGYSLGTITLMPYGGVIAGGERYSAADSVIIALAAPIFNGAVAICTVALWWLMPECYAYTRDVCVANAGMCLLNLLPVYPLDGYRVVFALCKNKERAVRIMRIAGGAAGVIFAALGAATVIYEFNPTLVLFGFFLIYGAAFEVRDAMMMHLASNNIFCKNFRTGVEKRRFAISADAPLSAIVRQLRRDCMTDFSIVGSSGEELYVLDEDDVGALCAECELSQSVGSAVKRVYGDITDSENALSV